MSGAIPVFNCPGVTQKKRFFFRKVFHAYLVYFVTPGHFIKSLFLSKDKENKSKSRVSNV